MPENGSINGGAGRDTGGISGGDYNDRGGARERAEQQEKFNGAIGDERKAQDRTGDDRDGLPPSDTTPGDYTGPNPDPRDPALSDPSDGNPDDGGGGVSPHDALEGLRQTINDLFGKGRSHIPTYRPEPPQDVIQGHPGMMQPIIDATDHMPLDDIHKHMPGPGGGGSGRSPYEETIFIE